MIYSPTGSSYVFDPRLHDLSSQISHLSFLSTPLPSPFAPLRCVWNKWVLLGTSLRSKRFRLVSEQRKTEERDSRFWPKNESWGRVGEGRKRLQTNPSILKTCIRQRPQRLFGSVSRTMLTCVDQRFVSYWEDGMVRDTYINFQWLLFILVGKICQRIFFDLFWNVRLFLRLN